MVIRRIYSHQHYTVFFRFYLSKGFILNSFGLVEGVKEKTGGAESIKLPVAAGAAADVGGRASGGTLSIKPLLGCPRQTIVSNLVKPFSQIHMPKVQSH